MLKCHRCQCENSSQRRYCGSCGAGLTTPCLHCGFGNASDDKYCGGCGRHVTEIVAANSNISTSPSPAAPIPTAEIDQGMQQLLAEVSAEQSQKEDAKKFFDASELESLFDDDPSGTPPGNP